MDEEERARRWEDVEEREDAAVALRAVGEARWAESEDWERRKTALEDEAAHEREQWRAPARRAVEAADSIVGTSGCAGQARGGVTRETKGRLNGKPEEARSLAMQEQTWEGTRGTKGSQDPRRPGRVAAPSSYRSSVGKATAISTAGN